MMTSKERITTALRNGIPDRVPVTMGLSEMVPVRYFGDDYIEFFWKNKTPVWRARVETEYDRFGSDSFIHLVEDSSPSDPTRETVNVHETRDTVTYTDVIHTAKGDLSADYYIGRKSPISSLTRFVKDIDQDYEKILELLKNPGSKNLDEMREAYEEIGDRAHVGFWLPTPIDWWGGLRGTQTMIMDLLDYSEVIGKLFHAYTEYAVALLDHVLKNTVMDSVCMGGSSTSASVISPDLHRSHNLAFGKAVCNKVHEFDIPVQYHMCGKSRQMLPITSEMGVDAFDALECAPTGDVDLAEVKRTFGERIALRGNVNSITVMLNGGPEDVRKAVADCMDAAKADGGYILGVGDQTPYDTPEDNFYAYVEAGRELGAYSRR